MKQLDGRILQLQRLLGKGQQVNKVIEEMANTFNITPLYLKQLFKEQTGQTIFQFDKDLRLENARYLIETTHMNKGIPVGNMSSPNFLEFLANSSDGSSRNQPRRIILSASLYF